MGELNRERVPDRIAHGPHTCGPYCRGVPAAGYDPALQNKGGLMQQQPVHGKIKLHGRPAGRPYDLTGIGIYDFVRNFRKAVGRAS